MTDLARGGITSLKERLSELNIIVAKIDDGFIAYNTAEPLFCLESKTFEELRAEVSATLHSYSSTFFNINHLTLAVSNEDLPDQIPVQEAKPISRFRPSFDNNGHKLGLCAAV